MYVGLRNSCPWVQSPLNSEGNAGGGGHPKGEVQMGVVFSGFMGRVGGGCFCSNMSFSKFRNPFIRVSNCFWVSCSLAFESARACSNAVKQDSSELGACCCEGSIAGEGLRGDLSRGEY